MEEAIDLDQLRDAAREDSWQELLHPIDRVLESWHAALLGQDHTLDVRRGRLLLLTPVRQEFAGLPPDTPCRAYSEEGEFLAILRYRGSGRWHPERVYATL